MLTRLDRRRLGEAPLLKELQRGLVEDAQTFYQGILDRADSPDPAVRLDTAVACRRAAELQLLLGRSSAAKGNYERPIRLLEGLPAEHRHAWKNQLTLAGCHNNQGLLASNARQWDEAERCHRAALAITERRARLDDPAPQSALAETEHNLGVICQLTGRWDDARDHYARAVAIRTALVRDHPGQEDYRGALAEGHINLGVVALNTKRAAAAAPEYEKAEALFRPLIVRHPSERKYALSLAALYINWSYLLRVGQPQAALGRLGQAVELAEGVLRQEPSHSVARDRAFNAHGARAQVLEILGRYADAVKDWDRVVALDSEPSAWVRRALRVATLVRAGEHTRATAEAQALAKDAAVNAEGLYHLAGVYARAVPLARADARLPPTEREALAGRYGRQAVALLEGLRARAYFKDTGRVRALHDDADLRPLRGRTDFQHLLAAIAETKQG